MSPGSLGYEDDEHDYCRRKHGSCQWSAELQSTLRDRLIEKVADCGAEWPRSRGGLESQRPAGLHDPVEIVGDPIA